MPEFNLDVLAERIYTEYANLLYHSINVDYTQNSNGKRFITMTVSRDMCIYVNSTGIIEIIIPLDVRVSSALNAVNLNLTRSEGAIIPIAEFETEEECLTVLRCVCRKYRELSSEEHFQY